MSVRLIGNIFFEMGADLRVCIWVVLFIENTQIVKRECRRSGGVDSPY